MKEAVSIAVLAVCLAFSSFVRAQNVLEIPDSVLSETPALAIPPMELPAAPGALSPVTVRLPGLDPESRLNENGVRVVPENLRLPSPFASPYWYRTRNAAVAPYRYSYLNPVEGGDMVGIGAAYQISDRFSVGGGAYLSSAYFGPVQPMRITNGSLRLNANYRVTDWLMVYGHGQVSVAPGMNPAYMSTVGPANYYGAGMQVKLTNKIGLGFGVARSYWQGEWTTSYQYYPVFY